MSRPDHAPGADGLKEEPTHHILATYDGWFDLSNPGPDQVRPEEVVRSLAHQVRYGGHTAEPYTIAQHSCACHEWAKVEGASLPEARAALLHDAAEAYCRDLPRPLRRAVQPAYADVIGRVEEAVAQRFRFDHPPPELVKEIDHQVYLAERQGISSHPDIHPDVEVPGAVERVLSSFWPAAKARRELSARLEQVTEDVGAGPWAKQTD